MSTTTQDTRQPTRTPAEIRKAVEAALSALEKCRGYMPSKVGGELQAAHRALMIALSQVERWESALQAEAEESRQRWNSTEVVR